MRITVLGKSPAWQDAGGACSGYLIEDRETKMLLDCGNGVFGKLRRHIDYTEVDGVLITHLHADHMLDLVPYSYALTYAPRQQPVPVPPWPGTETPARPKLHAPPGAQEVFRRIVGSWGNEDLVEGAFDLAEYDPERKLRLGSFEMRFQEVPHFITTYAVDVRSRADRSRFTFSADCSPNEALVDFASGTELLLIEATLPRPERTGIRGHLTPREAGEHAKAARARRCVLTHISDELDATWARKQGEDAFGAPVELASDGAVFEV